MESLQSDSHTQLWVKWISGCVSTVVQLWWLGLGFFFSFLYWDQNIFKCKLIATSESACIRHLLFSSGDLQKWVCDSWVNVFLVCSEPFHSIVLCIYRVLMGFICSAQHGQEGAWEQGKKVSPWGWGRHRDRNVVPSEPSSHMLQEEVAYITEVSHCW